MATFNFTHTALGPIAGRLFDSTHNDGQEVTVPVAHFRSIPYATIPARFRQSVRLHGLPDYFDGRPKGVFTEYGAACPQIPQPTGKGSPSGGCAPGEGPVTYDEFSCLNLTISAPVSALGPEGEQAKELLPVMVYVHGGALTEGKGHVSAQHETVKMAELASSEGMGVVLVSIGYRLNWQGFATSRDLLEEARELGEPAFNYGLRDQRNAFLWIKDMIAGFGGNPADITAFGESAGAVSLYMHACSDVPLFNRVVFQSGSAATLEAPPLEEQDEAFRQLLAHFGIATDMSAKETLVAIREVPIEDIIDYNRGRNMIRMSAYLGPEADFFPDRPWWANQGRILAGNPWLGDIMIGGDFFEGWVTGFYDMVDSTTAAKACDTLAKILGPDSAQRITEAYGIGPGMDSNLFQRNGMLLLGDLIFGEPTHSIALDLANHAHETGKRKIYRWEFSLPNPFPGSMYHLVHGHHFVELYYQFMTLVSRYPAHRNGFLARQAEQMARMWIRFANGLPPMENSEYRPGEERIMTCDVGAGWRVRTRAEDDAASREDPWGERRYRPWEMLREEIVGAAARIGGPETLEERSEKIRRQLCEF
jgi:carboxylesterase type B